MPCFSKKARQACFAGNPYSRFLPIPVIFSLFQMQGGLSG